MTNLSGRQAHCGYGQHKFKPSSRELAFFEYRGPGSLDATESCTCGYMRIAHDCPVMAARLKCKEFTLRGPREFDTYYCGCRGWE